MWTHNSPRKDRPRRPATKSQTSTLPSTFRLRKSSTQSPPMMDLDPAGVGAAARGEPGEVGVAGADGAALLTQTRQSPPRNLERWGYYRLIYTTWPRSI